MLSTFYAKSLVVREGAPYGNKNAAGPHSGYHVLSFHVEPGKSGRNKVTVTRKNPSDEYGMNAKQKVYTLRGKNYSRFMNRIGSLENRGVVRKGAVEGMYRRVIKAGSGSYGGSGLGSVSSGIWAAAKRAATPLSRRYS